MSEWEEWNLSSLARRVRLDVSSITPNLMLDNRWHCHCQDFFFGGGGVLCGDLVILSYTELSQLVIRVDTGLCSPQESQL